MASPQAMARSSGHDRVPASAGGHGHNEALRAIPPEMNKERMHPGGMPETDGTSLASFRDAVISMLSSGGIGRFATLTTG
jgi:hypothetical protein